MIFLFTDFGTGGPYLGQMRAALHSRIGNIPVIDLMSDAPTHNPRAASYLLAAYSQHLPVGSIIIAVVDPGVGSDQRACVFVNADGRFYFGPGNGLFGVLQQTAADFSVSALSYDPGAVSLSFHGRDVFAPYAAKLFTSELMESDLKALDVPMPVLGPSDLFEIVYVDAFGNMITGVRAASIAKAARLIINDEQIPYAPTFACSAMDKPFWYVNSSGLVEIAVNCGRADRYFDGYIGQLISLQA